MIFVISMKCLCFEFKYKGVVSCLLEGKVGSLGVVWRLGLLERIIVRDNNIF